MGQRASSSALPAGEGETVSRISWGRRALALACVAGIIAAAIPYRNDSRSPVRPVRLVDSIESVISPYAGFAAAPAFDESATYEVGHGQPWRPVSLARQFGSSKSVEAEAAPEAPPGYPWPDGRIPAGMGLAHVFDVTGWRGIGVSVTGEFSAGSTPAGSTPGGELRPSQVGVQLFFLRTPAPPFLPQMAAGQLGVWIGASVIGAANHLEVTDLDARGSRVVPPETRSAVVLIENRGDTDARIDRLRMQKFGEWRTLVTSDPPDATFRTRGAVGPTSRPSLVAPPGTRLVTRDIDWPVAGVLEVHLAARGSMTTPLTAKIIARSSTSGEEELLWERSIAEETSDWIAARIDVPAFDGPMVIELSCDGDATDEDPPFLVFGAPILLPPDESLPDDEERRPNVLLIVLDTLRADRVGAYGGGDLTPAIDQLAGEGVRFLEAQAQSSYTLPTHVSMFSGLFPRAHGVLNYNHSVGQGLPVLASELARAGYLTAGYNGGVLVSASFGLDQGFDVYCEVDPLGGRFATGVMPGGKAFPGGREGSLPDALDYVTQAGDRPWFMFLHSYMAHSYLPKPELASRIAEGETGTSLGPLPTLDEALSHRLSSAWTYRFGITEEDREWMPRLYAATVSAVDQMVAETVAHLKAIGAYDDTIIIVTSDHGEELLDHGNVGHAVTLYDEVTRIPMIFRGPGIDDGGAVPTRVRQVDLLPTVLDLVGLAVPDLVQGRSLKDALTGGELRSLPSFAVVRSGRRSIVWNDYKLILNDTSVNSVFSAATPVELFDLERDPEERRNLAADEVDVVARMRDRMEAFESECGRVRDALANRGQAGVIGSISLDMAAELAQLGYLVDGDG